MAGNGVKLTKSFAQRVARAVNAFEGGDTDLRGKPSRDTVRRPPQAMFAVRVTKTGGSAGSVSTTCSFVYTATLDSGFELGTELSPEKCRLPNVPYDAPGDGDWGCGFFDREGTFVLWDANECPQVEDPCPTETVLDGGGA